MTALATKNAAQTSAQRIYRNSTHLILKSSHPPPKFAPTMFCLCPRTPETRFHAVHKFWEPSASLSAAKLLYRLMSVFAVTSSARHPPLSPRRRQTRAPYMNTAGQLTARPSRSPLDDTRTCPNRLCCDHRPACIVESTCISRSRSATMCLLENGL